MVLSMVIQTFILDYLSFKKQWTKFGYKFVNGQKIDVEFLKGQYWVQFSFEIL